MKKISNDKMLCGNENYFIYSKGYKIYIEDKRLNKKFKVTVDGSFLKKLLSQISVTRRLLRLEPRCGCFLDNNTVIFSMKGVIYKLDANTHSIEKEYFLREGMNNPLSFSIIENVEGFDDGVVFGDYIGGGIQGTVDIHLRLNSGKWKKVFSFPENQIKHIHKILPSIKEKCLFVFTGDSDSESAIWKIENNYKKITKIVGGTQKYRGCIAYEYNNGLIYATDIPTRKNYIYYLDYSDLSVEVVSEINGPCIYGTELKNDMFVFSTSVEPDDRIKGLRYVFGFRKGPGIQDYLCHVYIGNPKIGFNDVYQQQKDCLPMSLFGLGTIQFPTGIQDRLYITCHALKKGDGCTLEILF